MDIVAGSYLTHQAGDSIVQVLGQGIELFWKIESDDSDFAIDAECDRLLRGRHGTVISNSAKR